MSEKRTNAKTMIEVLLLNTTENNGCLEWNGTMWKTGYGRIWLNKKQWGVHNLIMTLKRGRRGDKVFACHTCDNPACINPNHLYWGSRIDNAQDAVARKRYHGQKKTHCSRGHAFDEENTYIHIKGKYRGRRGCRACCRLYSSKEWLKMKKLEKANKKILNGPANAKKEG